MTFYSQHIYQIAILSLCVYAGALALMFKRGGGTVFLGFALVFIVGHLRGFLALTMIESGAYIAEFRKNGFPNGGLFFHTVFSILVLYAIFLGTRRISLPPEKEGGDHYDILFFAFFLIEIFLALLVQLNSNAEVRFGFYKGLTLSRFFLGLDLVFGAMYYAQLWRKPRYFWLWGGLRIIWGFARYAHFGAIYFVVETCLGALLIRNRIRKIHMAIALCCMGVALLLKLKSLSLDINLLHERFVMDAHVFWGAINLALEGRTHHSLTVFFNHFFDFSISGVNFEYGLGELMMALSPDVAKGLIENDIRFSTTLPSMVIYKAGIVAALPLVLLFTWIYIKASVGLFRWAHLRSVPVFLLVYKMYDSYKDFVMTGEYGYFRFKYFLYLVVSGFGLWLWSQESTRNTILRLLFIDDLRRFFTKYVKN